jgi:circadian clock protein KaiC
MTRTDSIIRNIPTGIPGLDVVLGGGFCEYSFNLIAGGPGAGKTTLVQQILFANATPERPALYFTVLGEPTLKMLRYQRQFAFFDETMIPGAVRFVNLSGEASAGDLEAVLDRVQSEVASFKPAIVAVDSFRTIAGPTTPGGPDYLANEHFVQRLAQRLTTWEVTSFLIGEYSDAEQRNPIFTVADGILWLSEDIDRNSAVRKIRVSKVRGRSPMPGLHTFRITESGLRVFPRIPEQQQQPKRVTSARGAQRIATGIPGLNEMMGGGIPVGDVVMITGPAGSGKTTFGTQFIAQGLNDGECCVVAVFEEFPDAYLARAKTAPVNLAEMVEQGRLAVVYFRPLDLSVDEMLTEILSAVIRLKATRVVIDSLSGFEVALAPTFRTDFKESLYRLVGALTAAGVTVMMTAEVVEAFPHGRFTSERVSFVTDDIIVQRYVEIGGRLAKVLAVVKMRGSDHSPDLRLYSITSAGAVVGKSLAGYQGITTGVPMLSTTARPSFTGLTEEEEVLLESIRRVEHASLDHLVAQTGVSAEVVLARLKRLISLSYVADGAGVSQDGYRATSRTASE